MLGLVGNWGGNFAYLQRKKKEILEWREYSIQAGEEKDRSRVLTFFHNTVQKE